MCHVMSCHTLSPSNRTRSAILSTIMTTALRLCDILLVMALLIPTITVVSLQATSDVKYHVVDS